MASKISRRHLSNHARVILGLLLIAALVLTLAAGCKRTPREGKEGGVLSYYLSEPETLDPALMGESEGIMVGKQIYDGLVDYDPETLKVIPAIAASWESNDEATEWIFNLKEGVKFHNGRECKAEDFVYSWNRVAKKETASEVAYHLAPIEGFDECQAGKTDTLTGVEAVDDYTLKVTLGYPYTEFVTTLGHPVFSPVPEEAVEKWKKKFSEHPVGTGPFKFSEWKHDQKIVTKKNDDYYGDKPYLNEVVFKIFSDENSAFTEFKAGGLDVTTIPMGQVERTRKSQKYSKQISIKPILKLYFYAFDLTSKPWNGNRNLRQAMNYCADKKSIARTIFEGAMSPATGIVPKGTPGFQEGAMTYYYNVNKAKDLLKKAGYPGGSGLSGLTLAYDEGMGHDKVAQAYQATAKEAGVEFDIAGYEWGTFLDKMGEGEFNFFRGSWTADYPSMDAFLYPLFYSESGDNVFGYENGEVDELLNQARSEISSKQRTRNYRKAEKIILEGAPVVPVGFEMTRWVVQPEVKGFERTGMDDTPLENVWLD